MILYLNNPREEREDKRKEKRKEEREERKKETTKYLSVSCYKINILKIISWKLHGCSK